MPLPTEAEQWADKAREISEFSKFSLPGVRERVAELLGLIGKLEGIFTTYTKHDISHIDSMLKMLKWLIPPSTSEKMTSSDWLLIVLAIYLHDLGMLVTAEEFEKRDENPEYKKWFESLHKTNEGKEYIARTHRMTPTEKQRFFFQEFVRMGHASRIREWITGRHSRTWGIKVKPIADAVAGLLEPLPNRFRQYLGDVCESHHANDLDRTEKFPLYAPCGSDDAAVVNVQYAAILLRTTDLLHVTQDRTPSIMFQIVRLSDPKGVDEWDKQLGTFSVRPRKREIDEKDPESSNIQISADFREERPLFALQEYIAYANAQIVQSKRWADKSQLDRDGQNYFFPWHGIRGDVRLEGVPPRPLKFELDRGRLLDLLVGHTIYNDPTVAIRELLQNGIDAVRYQHHLATRQAASAGRGSPPIGKVRVCWNPQSRALVVEDDGVGMDEDIIKHHLMTVGSSYYNTPQFEAEHGDFSPISRFGIGILTCFMVSDDIEIVTCRGGKGFRIRMTSVHADYLLRELPARDSKLAGLEPHGTRVTLRLRDTIDFSKRSIADIVRYWVIIPACSVEYDEEGEAPQFIGFKNAEEALRNFNKEPLIVVSPANSLWKTKTDFIVKTRHALVNNDSSSACGSYELAFAVNATWSWERSFTRGLRENLPAVCIEGIRVADCLPWCRPTHLNALLAVSGDRRFRTTVSRSGLEIDDEYNRVGALCVEMLFDHIKDEVQRIADRPGNPFSQASSASKWLFDRLFAAGQSRAGPLLDSLYNALPSMVIERLHTDHKGTASTTRSMLSRSVLAREPEFWTVESRLVDSLGTISRDLGRELSLNEFLTALAPDSKHLQYTPLIPDGHLFMESLERSHIVSLVQFSRQHQQAAIGWTRGGNQQATLGLDSGVLFGRFSEETINLLYGSKRELVEFEANPFTSGPRIKSIKLYEASISGDDPEVLIVISRLGSFIKSGSNLARSWQSIRRVVLQTASSGADAEPLFDLYAAASMFARSLGVGNNLAVTSKMWLDSANELRRAAEIEKIELDLPGDLPNSARGEWIFNASRYWRDWSR
ncbi:MAG TPA: ATP-binding protein [Terriglobales bacterium]|nr:ATP-binding protein [Terriglobales bacterium]